MEVPFVDPRAIVQPSPAVNRMARAFTLVELLVVIGIIAVLVGMLLPALNRARQASISVQCESNMREIGSGILMFAQNHDGRAPGVGWRSDGKDAAWMEILSIEQFKKELYIPRFMLSPDSRLFCPSSLQVQYPGGQTMTGNTVTYHRCYAMNLYANGGFWSASTFRTSTWNSATRSYPPAGDFGLLASIPSQYDAPTLYLTPPATLPYTTYILGTKLSTFQDAANKYLVTEIERAADTINDNGTPNKVPSVDHVPDYLNNPNGAGGNSAYVDPLYPPYTSVNNINQGGLISYRHLGNKRANFLYVDGHVESKEFDAYARDARYLRPVY